MGVRNFLNALFRRKIVEQRFITRTPESVIKEMWRDHYGKQILKENAEKDVAIIKLQKQVQEKNVKKQLEKEEQELEKEIWQKRVNDKKLEKQHSVILKLIGAKPPKLFTRTNRAYGRFIGFYIKETDDDETLFYPLIKDGRKMKRINCAMLNPMDLFKSKMNIPSQLREGKLDTNIDFTEDRRAIIVRDKNVFEKILNESTGKKISVLQLDELERREYEKQINELKERLGQFASALREANLKEVQYENELNDADLNAAVLEKDRDLNASKTVAMMDKMHKMAVETAKSNAVVQESVLNQVLTEKMNKGLLDAFDQKIDSLSSKLSKDEREATKEEVKKDLMDGVAIRQAAERAQKIVITPEKTFKKELEGKHKSKEPPAPPGE